MTASPQYIFLGVAVAIALSITWSFYWAIIRPWRIEAGERIALGLTKSVKENQLRIDLPRSKSHRSRPQWRTGLWTQIFIMAVIFTGIQTLFVMALSFLAQPQADGTETAVDEKPITILKLMTDVMRVNGSTTLAIVICMPLLLLLVLAIARLLFGTSSRLMSRHSSSIVRFGRTR